jgi:predicted house-cleaning noncanonical NTP pyrophosphatase (MazG superfamily)
MRKEHNKLVRDLIPGIIEHSGNKYEIEVMTDEDYHSALLEKLVEEAKEIVTAKPDELVEELADLYEVIDSIMEIHSVSHKAVTEKQAQRRETRGGFKLKIRLLWTE